VNGLKTAEQSSQPSIAKLFNHSLPSVGVLRPAKNASGVARRLIVEKSRDGASKLIDPSLKPPNANNQNNDYDEEQQLGGAKGENDVRLIAFYIAPHDFDGV